MFCYVNKLIEIKCLIILCPRACRTRLESSAPDVQREVCDGTNGKRPGVPAQKRALRCSDQVSVRETLYGIGDGTGGAVERLADG